MSDDQNRTATFSIFDNLFNTAVPVFKLDAGTDRRPISSSDAALSDVWQPVEHSQSGTEGDTSDGQTGTDLQALASPGLHQVTEHASNSHESSDVFQPTADGSAHGAIQSLSPALSIVVPVIGNGAGDSIASFAATLDQSHVASGLSYDSPHLLNGLLGAHTQSDTDQGFSGAQPDGSGGGDPDGQLWEGDTGPGTGTDDGHSDFRITHDDSDGLTSDQIRETSDDASGGGYQDVGLDTAANLVFGLDSDYQLHSFNLATGVQKSVITAASQLDGDLYGSMVVDPANDTIFFYIFGGDYADSNPSPYASTLHGADILEITYDPSSGEMTSPYNPSLNGGEGDTDNNNGILFNGGTASLHSVDFGLVRGMVLSSNGGALYYADDNDGDPEAFWGFSTNGIYSVSTTGSVGAGTAPTPTLLSSQSQFPTDYSNGYIIAVAVNEAQGIIYFATDQAEQGGGSTSQDALWEMPIAGGTATKMTLPGGVSLDYVSFNGFSEGLAFDPDARTLYVSDVGQGRILQLTLNGAGTGFSSGNDDFRQIDTDNPSDADAVGILFASLASETGLSGTSTKIVQGGSAVNLVTADPTITNPEGSYIHNLSGVTIEVIGGTNGDGTSFGITSGALSGAVGHTGDELLVNGEQSGTLDGGLVTVSWNSTTDTLTLTGDVSESEYQTLIGELSYQDAGTDSNSGSHPTRVIDIIANDGISVANPTTSDPNEETISVTLDRAPTVHTESYSLLEGASSNGTGGTGGTGVLGGDSDLDGDSLTITAVDGSGANIGNAVSGTYGSLTVSANGTFSYSASNSTAIDSAATGSHPVDSFTVTVSDGEGGTTTETVSFTIDRAPTVVADQGTALEGASGTGNVLSNDSDKDGDSLTVTEVNSVSGNVGNSVTGTYGTITIDSNGSWTYNASNTSAINSAATGSHPTDTFTYQASDGHGGFSTTTITVTIDRPTEVGAGATITYESGQSGLVMDSGATAADPDGDNLTGAVVKITSGFLSGDDLNFSTQNGISGTYNSSNGTLTLTGSASAADYQTALESITYSFSGSDPTNGGADNSRTISWTVSSAVATGNTATSTVDVELAAQITSTAGSTATTAVFATSHTVTVDVDVNRNETVAAGTQLTLSDGTVVTYVSGSGTEDLVFSGSATDAPGAYTISSISSGSVKDANSVSLVVSGEAVTVNATVSDTAAHVSSNFDSLESAVSNITSITLTDGGTPNLDLTAAQALDDTALIGKIVSSYNLVINDSASNVASNIDGLETDAANISSVVLNDGGTPTLTITQTQETNDHTILAMIQGPYDLHVTGVTGHSYSSYTVDVNASNTITEATYFNNDSSQTIVGLVSGLTLAGTANVNTFDVQSAPDVTINGSGTTDYYYFGAGLTASDTVNGGGGATNIVILNGDYSSGLTLGASTFSGVQELVFDAGHTYNITANAATVGSGDTLSIYATSLGSSDGLTFNGSAVTNGNFTFYLGAGTYNITDGSGNDTIHGGTGTDTINLGSGTDLVAYMGGFTISDSITGGGGTSTLELNGDYSAGNALAFNATTISGVNEILLIGGNSYSITTDAANNTSGHMLTINAADLGASDTLSFNGSANAGAFDIYAGAGTNDITGGTAADTIWAAGSDTFEFVAANDVTSSTVYDTIHNISFTNDVFDLSFSVSGVQAAITTGNLSLSTFQAGLTRDLASLGAHDAVLFTASGGSLSGQTFLVINDTGTVGYHTGDDLVIHLEGTTGTLTTSNFESV